MQVTVAICTWNRAAILAQTLERMLVLKSPDTAEWRLLVVDNNSTDETQRVLRGFIGRLPLDIVSEPTPGLSHARNRAIAEARRTHSDYILWTDDDVLVDEIWLQEFVGVAHRYPAAGVIGGPITPWFPNQPDTLLIEAFPTLQSGFCGIDHRRPEGPLPSDLYVWGANFGLNVSALRGIDFDPSLGPAPNADGGGGDELKVIYALRQRGHQVVWCPTMRVQHYVEPRRMTLSYLAKYTEQKGRESVLFAPADGSARLLDAPRWFWREMTRATAAYALTRVGLPVSGPAVSKSGPAPRADAPAAVRRLIWQREYKFLRGMHRGYREIAAATRGGRISTTAGAPAR